MSTPTDDVIVNPSPPMVTARPSIESGLSDLAVSPYGTPLALLNGDIRVAFLGRTSTEEQQDPRNSLIRQLYRSRGAIPEAWRIVAHFWDVESGRMELDQRGRKDGYERFSVPIPRDGGIADLLDQAAAPDRGFDVAICGVLPVAEHSIFIRPTCCVPGNSPRSIRSWRTQRTTVAGEIPNAATSATVRPERTCSTTIARNWGALRDWCRFTGAGTSYIAPGSPWQNPLGEGLRLAHARGDAGHRTVRTLLEARGGCCNRSAGSRVSASLRT